MAASKTGSGASQRKKAPKRAAADTVPASALNIVTNPAAQTEEKIEQAAELRDTRQAVRPGRVVDNPAPQAVEEITPRTAESNAPRLANGFRIVPNRAHQRAQKIKAQPLTVPVGDEMGYKKLFTRFEEAFLAQDIPGLRACLSPAFQWRLPNGAVVYGRQEALDEMERRFAAPNGPRFSKSVWRFEGTTVLQSYEVEYMGPDGRWRSSRGFDLYEIGDGLITLKDAYWKMIP